LDAKVQTKKFGEENRHFESWRGKKIGPLARIYTPAISSKSFECDLTHLFQRIHLQSKLELDPLLNTVFLWKNDLTWYLSSKLNLTLGMQECSIRHATSYRALMSLDWANLCESNVDVL
jgi:hypothetical protein